MELYTRVLIDLTKIIKKTYRIVYKEPQSLKNDEIIQY